MRFVKEKHQFGFFQVAHLGQILKQFAQHPQQKRAVEPGRIHQLVSRQDVDHAAPGAVGLHEVVDVEHRLTKELVAALLVNLHQAALNGANAGGTHIAVFGGELARVVAHMLAHGAQVFHVQQQHAVVVGNLEHQLQHAGLGLVQIQHACQQQRA